MEQIQASAAAPALEIYHPLLPRDGGLSFKTSGSSEEMYKKFMFKKTLIIVTCLLAAIVVVANWHTIVRCIVMRKRSRGGDEEEDEEGDALEGFRHEQGEDCKALKAIKVIKFVGELRAIECAICLCEFKPGEKIGVLPDCGHFFHRPCIGMWLFSHSSCPVCRHSLEADNV